MSGCSRQSTQPRKNSGKRYPKLLDLYHKRDLRGGGSFSVTEAKPVRDCVEELAAGRERGMLRNTAWGRDIAVPLGRAGKRGYGIKHIQEKRILHGLSPDDAAFVAVCAMKAAESVKKPEVQGSAYRFERFGIRAIVSNNEGEQNRLLTGFILDTKGGKQAVDSEAAALAQHFYALDELSSIQQVGAALKKAVARFEDIVNKNPHDWENVVSHEVEMLKIKQNARQDGTYMKAPNGEKTKLSERQWAAVRTEAFKDWFGDWERDPENASKVVDENGEPMVVYHGTQRDFGNVFRDPEEDRDWRGQYDMNYAEDTYWFADHAFTAQTYQSPQYLKPDRNYVQTAKRPRNKTPLAAEDVEYTFYKRTFDRRDWPVDTPVSAEEALKKDGTLKEGRGRASYYANMQLKPGRKTPQGYEGLNGKIMQFNTTGFHGKVPRTLEEALDWWNRGIADKSQFIRVAPTPVVLQMLGARALDLTITGRVLDKVTQGKHSIPLKELEHLPEAISDPIIVFESRTLPGNMVVLTEMKEGAHNVVVAVHLNKKKGGHVVINNIASLYGKEKPGALFKQKMLYINDKKAGKWLAKVRLQLPALPGPPARSTIKTPADLVNYKKRNNFSLTSFSVTDEHAKLTIREASAAVVKTAELLRAEAKKHGGKIYVRWTEDPRRDTRRGGVSYNHATGQAEAGLSVLTINAEDSPSEIAHTIAEYGYTFLIAGTPHRAWVFTGDELQVRGGDGEPLIANQKSLGYIDLGRMNIIMRGAADIVSAKEEIAKYQRFLSSHRERAKKLGTTIRDIENEAKQNARQKKNGLKDTWRNILRPASLRPVLSTIKSSLEDLKKKGNGREPASLFIIAAQKRLSRENGKPCKKPFKPIMTSVVGPLSIKKPSLPCRPNGAAPRSR